VLPVSVPLNHLTYPFQYPGVPILALLQRFFRYPIRGYFILLRKDALLMATATKKYPVILNMAISREMQTDLSAMAAKKNMPVAELVRYLLATSLSEEAASNGQTVIRQAVRAEIRLELKRVENRLATLGAKACIAASTTENMMVTLFERSIQGDTSEKKRQAKEIHDNARKKAVSSLKQSEGDDEDA
jgi:hypothetical protein